jgi:hypothetical protein
MRKFALLLAAAMLVGAPLTASVTTDTYAAAKKATKKAAKAPGGKGESVDPGEANSRFARALGDLANSLGTYIYVPGEGGSDKGGKGKAKPAKKTAKKGGGPGAY